MRASRASLSTTRAGFTLGETILVLCLVGMLGTVVLSSLLSFQRALLPRQLKVGAELLAVSPSYAPFPSAVSVHKVLNERLALARAVYVLGWRHHGLAAQVSEPALILAALPDLAGLAKGLPLDATSFYQLYADRLGERRPASSETDFTLVIIGVGPSGLSVSCLAQSRSEWLSLDEGLGQGSYRRHQVQLWDETEGPLSYQFLEPAALASGQYVGAVHTWFRHDPVQGVYEEGPACVVFPDPWLLAGKRGALNEAMPFSRFSYFIPVSA